MVSSPSFSGMRISVITTSIGEVRKRRRPSRPFCASMTSYPARCSVCFTILRICLSSSMIRIRAIAHDPFCWLGGGQHLVDKRAEILHGQRFYADCIDTERLGLPSVPGLTPPCAEDDGNICTALPERLGEMITPQMRHSVVC